MDITSENPFKFPVDPRLYDMFNHLDSYTYNHSVRVMELAEEVERKLHFTDSHLSEAGLFHDIGKYYISQKVLDKHDGLTSIERQVIDFHAFYSYVTLVWFEIPEDICEMALFHHGLNPPVSHGFPTPVPGADIVRKSLILQTVDEFEALTSDRPYHRRRSKEEAVSIIRDAIKTYDNETLDILLKRKGD